MYDMHGEGTASGPAEALEGDHALIARMRELARLGIQPPPQSPPPKPRPRRLPETGWHVVWQRPPLPDEDDDVARWP